MSAAEELRALARLVQAMRARQSAYFADRSSDNLQQSKKLERQVDRQVVEILAGPTLFDGGAA